MTEMVDFVTTVKYCREKLKNLVPAVRTASVNESSQNAASMQNIRFHRNTQLPEG